MFKVGNLVQTPLQSRTTGETMGPILGTPLLSYQRIQIKELSGTISSD